MNNLRTISHIIEPQNAIEGAGVRLRRSISPRVSNEFVERHIQIGIEALRLIRRHGKSVRHLRFDE